MTDVSVGDRVRAAFEYDPISGGKGFAVDAIVMRDRRTTPADYDTQQYVSTFPVEVCWSLSAADYFTNKRYAKLSWLTVTGRATEEEMNLLIVLGGKVREIEATEFNALLAYHPTRGDEAKVYPWTITHRPSGWSVAKVESEQRALWLCQKLERVPLSDSPDDEVVKAQAQADGVWDGARGGVLAALIRVAQRRAEGGDAAVIRAFFAGEASA